MTSDRGLQNVRFFPYQPKALLHDSFSAADVFVVSLKSGLEGFIVPSKVMGFSPPDGRTSPRPIKAPNPP
jgi:hypothetical protein